MLRLEALPAKSGDCLWLEYGEPGAGRIILIDGGLKGSFTYLDRRIRKAIRARGTQGLHIDLLVVTHIDTDHINGILKLLAQTTYPLTFGDIWFNGRRHLRSDVLGVAQGDQMTALIRDNQLPWNRAFDGGPAVISSHAPLPSITMRDGLKLTLLGPTGERLRELGAMWPAVVEEYDREEGTPTRPADMLGPRNVWPPVWEATTASDDSVTNGSSIAMLAEYGGASLLLTGDAFAEDLAQSLRKLREDLHLTQVPLPVSLFKLPHHGSAANVSQDLLRQVACRTYVISTDGVAHAHPDHQALLRILRYNDGEPHLMFNYRSDTTRNWHDRRRDVLDAGFQMYEAQYPQVDAEGIVWTH
jgi:hypothetical protein